MKQIFNLCLVLATVSFLVCASPGEKGQSQIETTSAKTYQKPDVKKDESGIPQIDVKKLQSLLNEGAEVTIIDVRTPEEIAEGKITADALEFDYQGDNFEQHFEGLDRKKEYIVYCAAGGRSGKTVGIMQDMGFSNVYNLKGGYDEWSQITDK